MNCRTICNLKRKLGFNLHDGISFKEQTVPGAMKKAFEGENMQTQYSVSGYRNYLYFYNYKFAVEVGESSHRDKHFENEIQRQKAIEKELGCEFIRINPGEQNSNIFIAINK